MLRGLGVAIVEVTVAPLSIPLREPFVIASGRLDATRAALVRATLEDDRGRRATGLGESAALPPVTREDQPELLQQIAAAAAGLSGARLGGTAELEALLVARLPGGNVARAGVETAILDAAARLADEPLYRALGGAAAPALLTDITLSISDPARMAAAAAGHARAGFSCFKVKVGRDWRADLASLRAVAAAVPGARFRLDANAGFTAREALALLDAALGDGLAIECYEQPCAAGDLAGMAEVAARSPVPVVADESFRGPDDLDRLLAARAAGAVNLKLVKLGGPLAAVALGRRARAAGLGLMAGAMVETRIGLLAMAHVVAALGGVEWVDLDTAFLLARDPFVGGWQADGPRLTLTGGPGLDVAAP
ncbi:MAG TPA: enolase C-terminal domain-like protein [Polyangia bacterium]|jgi:L-alanine-DL-glutamate epimerase-like enolase superfamily enzyme|nr:enolase C-terminal domain-like protein [Polyangia bacterium]